MSLSAAPSRRLIPSRRFALRRGGVVLFGAVILTAASTVAAGGAGAVSGPGAGVAGGLVRLPGSVPALPVGAQVVGPSSPATEVQADVSLEPRDPTALAAFASAVSTPGSPQYHHYLAPGQFATTFGPTAQTVAATRQWLASAGLQVGSTSANRLLIPVSGSVATMEQAFAVPLVQTRLQSGRLARTGTANPEVPADLAGVVGGVIGLSTVALAHPQIVPGPTTPATTPGTASTGSTGSTGTPAAAAPSTTPSAQATVTGHVGPTACAAAAALNPGAWTANQLASAYGFSTLYGQGRVAAGQRVAIYELEPYTPSDIEAYESCYGLSVPVSQVSVDGGAAGGQQGEAALDIEVVAGLAPSSSIVVYSGPNDGGSGPIDTYTRMVDDDSARVLSTSWGECEGTGGINPEEQQAETALFEQAASQGQTVFAASGDSGSSDCYDPAADDFNTQLSVDDPADQPDVTGAGGTSMTSDSTPPVESVWNNGSGAGGGGVSKDFAAPSWQTGPGVVNSATVDTCGTAHNQQCREVPDVSASADPGHGDAIFFSGRWEPIGGTSAAAPLWAALAAVGNQGCLTPAGLINPALYTAGSTGTPPFNDITGGNNSILDPPPGSGPYPAAAHYDLASGWGSPIGGALLSVFSGSASGCPALTGLSSASGPAVGGQTVVIGGNGFGTGAPTVQFGGAAATVTAHTPTSVTVVTPDVGTGQQVGVTVTSASGPGGGTSPVVPAGSYTFVSPQVTSVSPGKGSTAGGGFVTVSGSDLSGASSVRFGSTPAPAFTVLSPTALTAQVPPGPAGGATVDVTVSGPDGASQVVAADHYTYALAAYWMVASDGGIFNFGPAASFFGSTGGRVLNKPVVGMASTADNGGYWLVASDGGIFSFGDALFYGSTGNIALNRPIVGMAATPDGKGYWLVASDGGIFSFGDAQFYGSTGNIALNRPIVGMAATPDGKGYWLVASDGGVFNFGDAAFQGSTGNIALNRPIVGMATTPDGKGYWLVASDGGIFNFGDAAFHGSTGNVALNRPIVGMAGSLDGEGYWLVASDGGIFSFGDARFLGSTGNIALNRPIVAMAGT
jgi:Pro-kumamolisin, activation domain/IPT/TIG domain